MVYDPDLHLFIQYLTRKPDWSPAPTLVYQSGGKDHHHIYIQGYTWWWEIRSNNYFSSFPPSSSSHIHMRHDWFHTCLNKVNSVPSAFGFEPRLVCMFTCVWTKWALHSGHHISTCFSFDTSTKVTINSSTHGKAFFASLSCMANKNDIAHPTHRQQASSHLHWLKLNYEVEIRNSSSLALNLGLNMLK